MGMKIVDGDFNKRFVFVCNITSHKKRGVMTL